MQETKGRALPHPAPDAADGSTMFEETRYLACGCPSQFDGGRTAGVFRLRYSRYLPRCAAGVHHHNEARIVLPISGAFSSSYGQRMIPIESGGALYRPRGEAHADRYQTPTDCVALLLPDDGGLRRLGKPVVMNHPGLRSAALALRAEAYACDTASELVAEGIATLVATLVLDRAPLTEQSAPRWVGVVRERLDAISDGTPSLAELARSVDRHPAYVAATFQQVYGLSAGAYVRRLKLWEARDRIDRSPSDGLSEIAQDCGFADQSHFTRHFRRLFGVTPGAYRTRLLGQRR